MRISLIALIAANVWAPAVLAQDAGQPGGRAGVSGSNNDSNGEIVVTAQRRQESINSIPISIQAVSANRLQDQGIATVADLGKIVPGFHAVETGRQTVYSLRGIGFNDTSEAAKPSVSLSIDEAPLPFPLMTEGANLDLERIEVLKGPQGTLYGQNSTAGAVNFISAKPTDTVQAGIRGSYGSFNNVRLEGFVSGPLSSTLRARLALGTEQSGPWQKSYTRVDEFGRKNKISGRLIVDWQPVDDFKLALQVNGFRNNSDNQAAQMIGVTQQALNNPTIVPLILTYPLAPRKARAADWDPGKSFKKDRDFYQLILRGEYNLTSDLTVTSVTSYSSFRENSRSDPDGTALSNLLPNQYGRIKVFSSELRLAADLGRLHMIGGANYEHDSIDDLMTLSVPYHSGTHQLDAFGGPFAASANIASQRASLVAVFANADYKITDNLTARAGIRYTDSSAHGSGCSADSGDGVLSRIFIPFANYLRSVFGQPALTTTLPPGACVTLGPAPFFEPGGASGSLNENNVSWKAGVDWTPRPGALLYANISKGYKQGSYPNTAATLIEQFFPVRQESVLAYELGFKFQTLDRRLQLNGAAFYYDYSDKQLQGTITVPVFGHLGTLVNVPKSRVAGAELELDWRPVDDFRISAGGSYVGTRVRGDYTDLNGFGDSVLFSGQKFPLTPAWQGFADAQYDVPLDDKKLFFGGTVSYRSATNGTWLNPGNDSTDILRIPAYAITDLRVGVDGPDSRWNVTASVRNVFDRYYWTSSQPSFDTIVRYAALPRTFELSFRSKF